MCLQLRTSSASTRDRAARRSEDDDPNENANPEADRSEQLPSCSALGLRRPSGSAHATYLGPDVVARKCGAFTHPRAAGGTGRENASIVALVSN
jgi:hypothetical protein